MKTWHCVSMLTLVGVLGCGSGGEHETTSQAEAWHEMSFLVDVRAGDGARMRPVPRRDFSRLKEGVTYTVCRDMELGSIVPLRVWNTPKSNISAADYRDLANENVRIVSGDFTATPSHGFPGAYFTVLSVVSAADPENLCYRVQAVSLRGDTYEGYLLPEQLPETLVEGHPRDLAARYPRNRVE